MLCCVGGGCVLDVGFCNFFIDDHVRNWLCHNRRNTHMCMLGLNGIAIMRIGI